MRTTIRLLGTLAVICFGLPFHASSAEMITLFADAEGTDCSITRSSVGIVEVHMFHVGTGGRTAAHFVAPKPPCWTGATWLADAPNPAYLTLGTTQDDFSIALLGQCAELPVYYGKILFLTTRSSPECCEYKVLPAPTTEIRGAVVATDCAQPFPNLLALGGGKATINATPNCPCEPPTAVEESTWGRVKALYR